MYVHDTSCQPEYEFVLITRSDPPHLISSQIGKFIQSNVLLVSVVKKLVSLSFHQKVEQHKHPLVKQVFATFNYPYKYI
jgi:hypothetical protein